MVRLWDDSRAGQTVLGLAGLLVFPLSAIGFGELYLATHPTPGRVLLHGEVGVVVAVVLLLGACALTAVVHELIHALAMVAVGHRPKITLDSIPYTRLAIDRDDQPFERARFVLVKIAPVVVITVVLAVGIVTGPYAGWLIVPAAFHLTASKMDVAYSVVALRQPAGTMCRVVDDGLELSEPSYDDVP